MKNMKFKLFTFFIFSIMSLTTLSSQCEYFLDYYGIIATIAPNSTVGQSFEMNCANGDNAFKSITINHQAHFNVHGTLRIYQGETFTGTPQYEQDIYIESQGANVHELILLEGGSGSLMFEEGEMYTVTFVFQNQFRWNGRNSNVSPARALWPNNGGTWVTHFDYHYRIGTQSIITDSDGDGIDDPDDTCPDTPSDEGVNAEGCSCSQITVDDGDECTLDECVDGVVTHTYQDEDGDGVCDANDVCAGGDDNLDNDLDGTPDFCDEDDDNDGIEDSCDSAPFVDNYTFDGIDDNFPSQWLCGNNSNKVSLCHVPAGNPSNANTICISPNAVSSHLDNNADNYLGECTCTNENRILPGNTGFNASQSLDYAEIELVPNPATDNLEVYLQGIEDASTLTIFDQMGRVVWTQQLDKRQSVVQLDLSRNSFQNGTYVVTIQSSNGERFAKRLVIVK